jgi:acetyl esterase/lipase
MYPEAVHDVRAAIQYLRHRGDGLKVDSGRIGLIGDSGGAYLSALVALAGDGLVFVGAYKSPYVFSNLRGTTTDPARAGSAGTSHRKTIVASAPPRS